MSKYYRSSNLNPWNFIPQTYLVHNGVSDQSFFNFLQNYQREGNNSYWIIKPGENSNRGKGIQL